MYNERYNRWAGTSLEDPDLTTELESIKNNEDAIKERFAADLSFGTAGLRGVIGAGTNRMNIYTVRRATQGFAEYLLKSGEGSSVAIAYDSRIKSDLFAKEAACVLAANGIRAHIYNTLQPVPALSFAVRQLRAAAGIMITASHNPAKYNGYKAYGPDGCQLTTEASAAVYEEIEKLDIFKDIKTMDFDEALKQGLVAYISDEVLEAFYSNVKSQSIRPGLLKTHQLKLVYSPLNGAGNVPVRRVLGDMGVKDITIVPKQEHPDGNFPTCPYPNPEIRQALSLGLELAEKSGADLMLATDPDADRVGIAVRDKKGAYHLLSGNEVGVLLLDYICAGRIENGNMPALPVTVKSIVTTPMADAVAKNYNVEMRSVLTGFKYIGEQILLLENKGEKNRFLFGFEESYGYLAGTYVRDKDAIVASMLICEMAAYYGSVGSSLYQRLQELYTQYGYYLNKVDSFEFEGLAGMEKMAQIMQSQRSNPPAEISGWKVVSTADYLARTIVEAGSGVTKSIDLPEADVLIYKLENGCTVIVRPSGTEPKMKVYYTTLGKSMEEADTIQHKLAVTMAAIMN